MTEDPVPEVEPSPEPPAGGAARDDPLALVDLAIASLGRPRVRAASRRPLGKQVHRAVGRLVAVDLSEVRDELREVTRALRDAIARVESQVQGTVDPVSELATGRSGLARWHDDVLDRMLALEAALGAGPESIAVLLERVERLEQEMARRRPDTPAGAGG
ncbi:MAG: hypothetical protein ABSA40_09390 [Candidatus Dormibacteria bacterium]